MVSNLVHSDWFVTIKTTETFRMPITTQGINRCSIFNRRVAAMTYATSEIILTRAEHLMQRLFSLLLLLCFFL